MVDRKEIMMRILNLHGLGEDSDNNNYRTIRTIFPDASIISETIDYVNTNPNDIIKKYSHVGKIDVVVGDSLGGFLAYVIGIKLKVNTLLTNPLIPASDHISDLVENYAYTSELKSLWSKYMFQNEKCYILIGEETDIIDPIKIGQQMMYTAEVSVVLYKGNILDGPVYEDWMKTHLSGLAR